MNSGAYKTVVQACGTPTFLYSERALKNNIQRVKHAVIEAGLEGRVSTYVAYFTNSNPHLFRIVADEGVGATLQSIEELCQLEAFGLGTIKCIVSPTALSEKDLNYLLDKGLQVNVALPEELETTLAKTDNVGIRIDVSPAQDQRTGLKTSEFNEVSRICKKLGKSPRTIQTYPGTGSDYEKLIAHAEEVLKTYEEYFPFVQEINLGGGFAFNYEALSDDEKHFPWSKYFARLKTLLGKYQIQDGAAIAIEPGRDIFADVGEFLIGIQRVHVRPNEKVQQLFTDGSYVHMPSATIRTRQHKVKFLNKDFEELKDRSGYAQLNGCTTLSSDYVFPGIIQAPSNLSKGDFLVVEDIGAYGACQHMEFLNKRPAAEVLQRENGIVELITQRGTLTDKVRYMPCQPQRVGEQV